MSDSKIKNFKIYLRQLLDSEIETFIQFAAPSQKSALKRGIIAIRSGQVSHSTINRNVDKYIQLYSNESILQSLIDVLIVRAKNNEIQNKIVNNEAIKSGSENLSLSLANENGRYINVPFVLHELNREDALNQIEISEFNARDSDMLKPQDVAGLIATLPNGQREPAWAYRFNKKLYIFDGLRRFTAFKLTETISSFKVYVTDTILNIYMYASYDSLSEEKLERTPFEQAKFWFALAEKDGLKIGNSYGKEEKSSKDDVQDFCLRFNISYNTFAKYIRLLDLQIEWRQAMPFSSTLTIKQLESLLKLQKKCNELKIIPLELINKINTSEFNLASLNKTENNRINNKFINDLEKHLDKVIPKPTEKLVKRELYRSGDTNIQLESTIDSKGRSVDKIILKRFLKKDKEKLLREIETLINNYSF
ncbi:ParB N-terminal domain-containing protein [Vibrio harveyi]